MTSMNEHNKSPKDLYKSEDSLLDKVIGTVALLAFVVIAVMA
jgi:hypothetical protein